MDAKTKPYDLHGSVMYQLTLTSRMQERRLEEQLKTLGLTRVTWCTLLAVGAEGLRNPSKIAEFIGIDRTATSRALRGMEADGMIARVTAETDRRRTTVRLTERGWELLNNAVPMASGNSAHFRGKLDPAEIQQLCTLLRKLRAGEDGGLTSL